MLKYFLWVGLGGALGSMARFGVSQVLRSSHFPWATFLVNMIGCLLIGGILAFSLRHAAFEQNWRIFLATGVCGGFTTFSAFSLESMALLQQQKIALFLLYVVGSVLLGLLATWLGYFLLK
ncbi:MAG TPA: fluoride efflux transporter CrcB [Lacibacter sp.]|nr:fluoride efflux transporter CrcB [Lacibacter sp.]HMO87606.1 fluoride efflux transporter CrcB [Lacibacter sp.]HMP87312.1 fluoride efflux transporter CrcB [Lacibacter sp.]